mmetsp:Transcript_28424/g.57730  ORF Transcript_28424/g.57730 Transcript_28424/m.57730 type:complete len:256 (-) Transcript_28424:422-1189(-)
MRRLELEGHKRERHDDHSGDHGGGDDDWVAVVAVRGGEEFCKGDVDHHTGHQPEHDAVRHVVDLAAQHRVPEQRPDRLAHAAQRRPHEGPQPRAGRVVDGHGDTHALGDVVDGNGDSNSATQRGVRHGPDEGREALGEVVHGDREPRQQPRGVEPLRLLVVASLQRRRRPHAPELDVALAGRHHAVHPLRCLPPEFRRDAVLDFERHRRVGGDLAGRHVLVEVLAGRLGDNHLPALREHQLILGPRSCFRHCRKR